MPQDPQRKTELSLEEFEEQARAKFGVPKGLWESLKSAESGGDVNAVSPTGVRGRFQVTKRTAAGFGLDRDDPFHQAAAAAKYLREGYDKHASLKDENQRWLAAAGYYYGGPDAVSPDGTLSAASKDNLSNPQAYVTKIAQRWKEYNDSQSGAAQTTTTPQPKPAGRMSTARRLGLKPEEGMRFDLTQPRRQKRPSAEEELLGYDRFRRAKPARDVAKVEEDLLGYGRFRQIADIEHRYRQRDAKESDIAAIKARLSKLSNAELNKEYAKLTKVLATVPETRPARLEEERRRAEYYAQPLYKQVGREVAGGMAEAGGAIGRAVHRVTDPIGRALGYGEEIEQERRQVEESERQLAEEQAIANRMRSRVVRGITSGGGQLLTLAPAAALTGPAGVTALAALESDVERDPGGALASTIAAPVVMGAGRFVSPRAAMAASGLASRPAQKAVQLGIEGVTGAGINVGQHAAISAALGRPITAEDLTEQAIIGGGLSTTMAPRLPGRGRPAPTLSGVDPAILEAAARTPAGTPRQPGYARPLDARTPRPIPLTDLGAAGLRAARTPEGAIIAQPSSIASRRLLPPAPESAIPTEPLPARSVRPEDVRQTAEFERPGPETVRQTTELPAVTDAPTTRRITVPQPDAPDTQEMPAIRERIAAENAPTAELPVPALAAATESAVTANVAQARPTSRRPPAPPRPAGRLPRPLEGRMYAGFPADRRAMIGEGRRVGAEIEAGRGEKGQFGKIAQQMFKSPGQRLHGQDAFFHDPDVKGALGLSPDAEMNQVRYELKKEMARQLGVKAEEVSLTQIGPQIWETWARQKRLGDRAVAKMRAAIERYQQGAIDDIEKTVKTQAEEPQQRQGAVSETAGTAKKEPWQMTRREYLEGKRLTFDPSRPERFSGAKQAAGLQDHRAFVRNAIRQGKPVPVEVLADYPGLQPEPAEIPPAETGRKINHSKFGEVTEAPDQSGVRKGQLRVTDAAGKTHIIQNPRTGTGNQSAAFVKKEEPPKGTIMGSGFGALQGLFERGGKPSADQSGVSKGFIRVTDESGKTFITEKPRGFVEPKPERARPLPGQPKTPVEKAEAAAAPIKSRDVRWYDYLRSPLSNLNYKGTYERIAGERGREISEAIREAQIAIAKDEGSRGRQIAQLERTLRSHKAQLRAEGKPGLANWLDDHVNGLRDPDAAFSGVAGIVKKFHYDWKLRHNPRSIIINELQPLQTLWPHLTTREFAKIAIDARRPSVRARIKEIAQRESGGKVEETDRGKKEWLPNVFGKVSTSNKIMGHLAGELMADRLGLTGEAKARMAADWAKKVEFDNSRWDVPPLFRGQIASVVGQFKPFMIKNLERLYYDWKAAPQGTSSGKLARRAKIVTAQLAIGGVRSVLPPVIKGITGVLILGALSKALQKSGMEEDDANKVAETMYFGAPGLLEQDLSSSVMLLDEPFGRTPEEQAVNFLGPTLSLIVKAVKEGEAMATAEDTAQGSREEKVKAAALRLGKAASPYVKTGETVHSLATTGKPPKLRLGKEEVEKTPAEAVGGFLMSTPLRQTKFYEEEEMSDWQRRLLGRPQKPGRLGSLGGRLDAELRKHGLDYSRVDEIPGDTERTHRERSERVENWMKTYGVALLDSPRYGLLSESQQKAALETLRKRIGGHANERSPRLSDLRAADIIQSVRQSERRKPARDRRKIVVAAPD